MLEPKVGNDLEKVVTDHLNKQVVDFGVEKMKKHSEQLQELRTYFMEKCAVDLTSFKFGKTGMVTRGTITRDAQM